MSVTKLTLFVIATLFTPVVTSGQTEVIFSVKESGKHNNNIHNVTFSTKTYKEFHECICTSNLCIAYFTDRSSPYEVNYTERRGESDGSVYGCTIVLLGNNKYLRCFSNQEASDADINGKFIQAYRLENTPCRSKCITFSWSNGGEKITFSNKTLSPATCDFTPTRRTSTLLPLTSPASDQKRDKSSGPPVNVILGVVISVIVIAVIVIVGVVVWKRRKAASKSSDHSSRKPTQTTGTSSENSHEQNSKMKGGGEPYYVNTRPSTHVSNPHVSSNGHRNSSSMKKSANSIVQGNNGCNDIDFGYYTAHTVSFEKDDNDITNGTGSAEDNDGNQFNRTSDDYGYAHAEDPSNEGNTNIANKNGPSIVATLHSSVKNVKDNYDYTFCDDDEIPAGKRATTNSKDNNEVLSSSSKVTSSATKVNDEYAVVNKNGSVAKGDSINNGVSSKDDAGAGAGISSEAADVYSKLHENERHITDPYDSLLHLNSSSDAENQSKPAHKLHLANQSSPYDLAQPIPGTSANENGSSASVEFELVPVSSSAGKCDEKNQAQQGKKQAKKLPYGPEDYAVVIKNKPTNESKAAGFELDN